jgi:hypothetical protein
MASYPTTTKTFIPKADGQVVFAEHINEISDEVTAIESALLGGAPGQVLAMSAQGVPTWITPEISVGLDSDGYLIPLVGSGLPLKIVIANGIITLLTKVDNEPKELFSADL